MPNPVPQTTNTSDLPSQNRPNSFVPRKAMFWYDSIIDDMFSNPGTTIKATAERLNRSPVTVGYIINSDLFKARYAQRRDQFNEDLDHRLVGKLAKVAELSLDLTLEKLTTTRTGVPLPLLNDIMSKSLDRLGYGPKSDPATAVNVNVQQNNSGQVAVPVSAQALEEARASLRQVEQSRTLNGSSQEAARSVATDSGALAPLQTVRQIEHSSAVEDPLRGPPAVCGGPPEDLL